MLKKEGDFCFYTVCIGIDESKFISLNKSIAEKCTYYVFTDKQLELPGEFVQIVVEPVGGNNRVRSRYFKFFGCYFLPYRYSMYLDANILLSKNVFDVVSMKMHESVDVCFFRHNKRVNVCQEIFYCYLFGKMGFGDLIKSTLYVRYWCEPLFQGGVIFRNKKSKNCFHAMKKWWALLNKNFERDQVFGPMALKIYKLVWFDKPFVGVIHNSSFTEVKSHNLGDFKSGGEARGRDLFQSLVWGMFRLLWKK